jgi:VIT1/CCC1 family predicted Fe2+/Mn2+ transporter
LVSNVALILGVAGAHPHATAVRLAGLSGLLAGACSMALGEYVSMQGQKELFERELSVEREEIEAHPGGERKELQAIYMDRGVSAEVAGKMADELMSNSDVALDAHARDELGLDPEELGSPYQAAGSSFLAFAVGAFVPLISWFFLTGMLATIIAISVTLAASAGVGVVLGAYSGKSMFRSAARQVLLSATAAGITFGVGRLLGASGAA